LVVHESPDHAWSSGQWSHWGASLEFAECGKRYAFVGMKLAAREDIERLIAAQARLAQAEAEVGQMPVVQAFRSALAKQLDGMPSKAARHRWLVENRLDWRTYQTLVKHWRSGAEKDGQVTTVEGLIQAARACGIPFEELVAKQAESKRLKQGTVFNIPAVETGIRYLAA
jgi:hypothetical protein